MKPNRFNRIYSDEEIKYVRDNAPTKSDDQIALELNRTRYGIIWIRNQNFIRRAYKPAIKTTIRLARKEVNSLRQNWLVVQDMKALIILCELETNNYKRDKYKAELRKLSGL